MHQRYKRVSAAVLPSVDRMHRSMSTELRRHRLAAPPTVHTECTVEAVEHK